MAVPKTMATILVKNNSDAPPARALDLPWLTPSPEVATGGTNAAAIATPGNAEIKLGRPMAYAAATPLAKATTKSRKLGDPTICHLPADLKTWRKQS